MTDLSKYKQKLQSILEARQKATQGEWSELQYSVHAKTDSDVFDLTVAKTDEDNDLNHVQLCHNSEFIAVAANNIEQLVKNQIKLIEVIENIHEEADIGLEESPYNNRFGVIEQLSRLCLKEIGGVSERF